MTYVIASPCIDVLDKGCIDVCPVDCIYFDEGDDRMLYIHPDECIDCAACEPVCPVTAIFTDDQLPEKEKKFTELNAKWFQDKDAVRQQINKLFPKPRAKPHGG